MSRRNSQILLIENALSGLNKLLYEKEDTIEKQEKQINSLKETISTLKYEYKTLITENDKLEEFGDDLEKKNDLLQIELKEKEEQLVIKNEELDSLTRHSEEFLNRVEKKLENFQKQLDEKNAIIHELEQINTELNNSLHTIKEQYENRTFSNGLIKKEIKSQRRTISKIEKKLKQEEFERFIDSKSSYDFPTKEFDTTSEEPIKEQKQNHLNLNKLEGKLKSAKKIDSIKDLDTIVKNAQPMTEEEILKKKLGF